MNLSGVITNDKSKLHAKGRGQRSKVNVTEVRTLLYRFRTVTQFELTYGDEMRHTAWCCLEEVPYCFSRSTVKFQGHFGRFRTVTPEFTYAYEMMHKAWWCLGEVPYCFSMSSIKFQGHMALKIVVLTQIGRLRTVTPVWIHQWLRNDA